jgi:hypothetical protein
VKVSHRHDVVVTTDRQASVPPHAPCTRPPGASCFPLALIDHRSHLDHCALLAHSSLATMALDEVIDVLKVLVPIAKAVPILGAPVEGSLEALSKILEFAQARHSLADRASLSSADNDIESKVY